MTRKVLTWFSEWALVLFVLMLAGCSSFEISSRPTADIYENGERIGRTPYQFRLVSGARSFTLKRYGYVEEEVYVSSLDSKRLHYDLQWVGRTRIDSQPRGAHVIRKSDGEVLGQTPCGLHLSSGERVEIKLTGFVTVERDLTPNESYVVELKPKGGYKSAFYKDITFACEQGPVEIFDRIAGERLGRTPVRLNIEVGSALEYRLDGYQSKYDLISKNSPFMLHIVLDPITRVTLKGPSGAEVYRAGGFEKIGTVPYTVEVDEHALFEVKKEGYYEKSVSVGRGSPSSLRVELEKIPYKTIVTDPPGADVYRLGGLEKLGTAPFTTIIDGERVFEIKMKGYSPSVVGMGPTSPAQLSVPLNPVPRDDPDAAAIGTLDSEVVESF